MLGKKINSKSILGLIEVKEILKERSTEETPMTYEQQTAFDYTKKFVGLSKSKFEKLVETLNKIEGMTPETAVRIADLLPKDLDELNLLLVKGPSFSEEQKKAVLDELTKALK
ncbi:MAG: DNA-directed RNA polymerase subunit F [Candidatus Diapherotrites archaeon]|nr:DNA-directed RNA polymerase subunit F [Candidatus Diapherotrites archaeon]